MSEEDLDVLRRLMTEFETELAAIAPKVDNLEGRVAFLEDRQFSPTAKLSGNVIFAVADVFGGSGNDNQTVLQERVSLTLISSFTGRDALFLGLFAGNVPVGGSLGDNSVTPGPWNLPGVEVGGSAAGIPITGLISTAEGTLSSQYVGNTGNSLKYILGGYVFPVGEDLTVQLASGLNVFNTMAPTLNPYFDDKDSGGGSISQFGAYNPFYMLAGGGSGVMLNYEITDSLELTAGYLADGVLAGDPSPGAGLFNGGYSALGQLTWDATDSFSIAALYTNSYDSSGRFGFNVNGLGVTGTAVANTLAGQDNLVGDAVGVDESGVITNAYGVQFSWQPSSRFAVSGWFSTFYPRIGCISNS